MCEYYTFSKTLNSIVLKMLKKYIKVLASIDVAHGGLFSKHDTLTRYVTSYNKLAYRQEIKKMLSSHDSLFKQPDSPEAILIEKEFTWRATGDAENPFQTELEGKKYIIRINDFPEEPFYTLLEENGRALFSFNQWPDAWRKPKIESMAMASAK